MSEGLLIRRLIQFFASSFVVKKIGKLVGRYLASMNKKGSPYTREVEPHYSVTKAAKLVGVCRQTMSEYLREGRVYPVRRINRTVVLVPASSINRFLCNA